MTKAHKCKKNFYKLNNKHNKSQKKKKMHIIVSCIIIFYNCLISNAGQCSNHDRFRRPCIRKLTLGYYLSKREGVAEGIVHQLGHLLLELWNILALIGPSMMQDQLCHPLTLKRASTVQNYSNSWSSVELLLELSFVLMFTTSEA